MGSLVQNINFQEEIMSGLLYSCYLLRQLESIACLSYRILSDFNCAVLFVAFVYNYLHFGLGVICLDSDALVTSKQIF